MPRASYGSFTLKQAKGPSLETQRDLVTADQAEFGLLPAGKENFNI